MENYSLQSESGAPTAAPELPYQPPKPKNYNPPIALIGCGGITAAHLKAYQKQGFTKIRKTRANGKKNFSPTLKFTPTTTKS